METKIELTIKDTAVLIELLELADVSHQLIHKSTRDRLKSLLIIALINSCKYS